MKTSILEFCRERERYSTNHFNLHAALKTKLLNFRIHTPSGKTKKKRTSYTNKKRENGKLKIQQSSSLTFRPCFLSCLIAANQLHVQPRTQVSFTGFHSSSPKCTCKSLNFLQKDISSTEGVFYGRPRLLKKRYWFQRKASFFTEEFHVSTEALIFYGSS